jgi:hypothetical protein
MQLPLLTSLNTATSNALLTAAVMLANSSCQPKRTMSIQTVTVRHQNRSNALVTTSLLA